MPLRQNGGGVREGARFGAKVRALRRQKNLSQVGLAEKLGVSPSYLNLIENNRRPLPANLLIRLAQLFGVDVHAFATDEDTRLVADLTEAFADPMFESQDITSVDVRELAAASPGAARAVLSLYRAYQATRATADDLSSRLTDGEEMSSDGAITQGQEGAMRSSRHHGITRQRRILGRTPGRPTVAARCAGSSRFPCGAASRTRPFAGP